MALSAPSSIVDEGAELGRRLHRRRPAHLRLLATSPTRTQIRKIVEGAKVPVTSVQRYDKAEKNQVLLRVPMEKKEGRDVSSEVSKALTTALFPKGLEPGVFDLNLNGADALAKKLQQADPEKMAAPRRTPTRRSSTNGSPRRSSRPARRRASSTSVDAAAATPGPLPGRRLVAEGDHRRRALHAHLRRERRPARSARTSGRRGSWRSSSPGRPCSSTSRSASGRPRSAPAASSRSIHDTLDHARPLLPLRRGDLPDGRRGVPDAHRLLGQRHGRRLRPDPREPREAEEGAARAPREPLDQRDPLADGPHRRA